MINLLLLFVTYLVSSILCAPIILERNNEALTFQWQEIYHPPLRPLKSHQDLASNFIHQQLYISLTTIQQRLGHVLHTVESILLGDVLPDRIYLHVSNSPFLLDHGITESEIRDRFLQPLSQLNVSHDRVSVIFTENIGPHRKLLPLLSQKWKEDCVIVTIDDHEYYKKDMLSSLIKYYIASNRNAIISLRAHRIALCMNLRPWKTAPYSKDQSSKGSRICQWPIAPPAKREMLILPTGTGGVLYRPSFFHPIIFDRKLLNLTATGDDLTFRLATLAKGIPVVTACSSDTLDYKCPARPPASLSVRSARSLRSTDKSDRKSLDGMNDKNNEKDSLEKEKVRKQQQEAIPYGASLSSEFNNGGGNNFMWQQATDYLRDSGVLDLQDILQRFADKERQHCKLPLSASDWVGEMRHGAARNSSSSSSSSSSSAIGSIREVGGKGLQLLEAAGVAAKAVVQNAFDSRCGLVTC